MTNQENKLTTKEQILLSIIIICGALAILSIFGFGAL